MKEIKPLINYFILPIILAVIFNFLEYGLVWDRYYKFLYPIGLAIFFTLNLSIPKFRKFSLILSFSMLLLMIMLYLFGELNLSNIVGSAGIAALLIVLVNYLPEFLKKGYLEKL